jgi:hypothetical protein
LQAYMHIHTCSTRACSALAQHVVRTPSAWIALLL